MGSNNFVSKNPSSSQFEIPELEDDQIALGHMELMFEWGDAVGSLGFYQQLIGWLSQLKSITLIVRNFRNSKIQKFSLDRRVRRILEKFALSFKVRSVPD